MNGPVWIPQTQLLVLSVSPIFLAFASLMNWKWEKGYIQRRKTSTNNWVLGIQTGPFAACQAECLSNFYQRATLIFKSPIGPISEDRVSNEMSICRIYQIRPPHLSNTTTETDMNVQKHDAEVAWPAIFSAFQNVQKDVYEVAWPQNLMSFQISISLPVSFGSQKPTRSQIRSLSITFSWPFLHADL